MDYELLLFDRIEAIKSANLKHDIENNGYLSFSGGKDSTILHYLLDMALPNNTIPRVFIDTGIEYQAIREFVYNIAKTDKRIVILKPSQPIKSMLERVGYPFKSKEHSLRIDQFNRGNNANYLPKYLGQTEYKGKFMCPKCLLYQFEERGKYHYSNKCCEELKKKPVHKWQKANKKKITITGMRSAEGGNRERLTCFTANYTKFHPLIKVDEEWETQFVQDLEQKLGKRVLCELYYPPYNFKRTGCKGCPYALDLQEQLEIMATYLPNERKQCEFIWQPVYEEYRRINYRLKKNEEIKLF